MGPESGRFGGWGGGVTVQTVDPLALPCPACSSQMATVRSKEHVANTWPNSGCAQATFHTEPLWACSPDGGGS